MIARLWAVVQKEFLQIFRQKANLPIIFVMPFMQLLLLGFAATTDVKQVPIWLVDQSHSVFSREMTQKVLSTKTFRLVGGSEDVNAGLLRMDEGLARVVLVIPPNIQSDLMAGRHPAIQVMVDGVDGNTAGISTAYLTEALKPATDSQIQLETRFFYNPNLQSQFQIVPGVLAILLTMTTLFLSAVNLIRERESGTFEQLMVTPLKAWEILVGKLIPFAVLGLASFSVGLVVMQSVFHVAIRGHVGILYALSALYTVTTLGLGLLISTMARTQQQAMFFAWFFSIFAIMLSGFFIPIQNMPDAIQVLTLLNPLRYFMEVVRGVILKGAGFDALWPELGALFVFGVSVMTFASLRFQKRSS